MEQRPPATSETRPPTMDPPRYHSSAAEHDPRHEFARSVTEIQWLLLLVVLLFILVPGALVGDRDIVVLALVVYAAVTLLFLFTPLFRSNSVLRLALESLVMVGFITVVLWQTGKAQSPLFNLYLLPIITSALTLGRLITLLEMILICACYVLLSFLGTDGGTVRIFTFAYATGMFATLAPFLLVAYLTTLLATDIRLAWSRIQVLSETDELTGLSNMRAFSRDHHREHMKAERYDRPYSIMLLDMDNLKIINDQFGHEAGSRAIALVADVIKRVTRGTDVVARYGGDEFIVLLPETRKGKANEVAQRIRQSVYNATLDLPRQVTRMSVSIGVAGFPEDGGHMQDVIVKADQDMYRDKELRRAPPDQ